MKYTCDSCIYCDMDFSTGQSECMNELEGLTEEEVKIFDEILKRVRYLWRAIE